MKNNRKIKGIAAAAGIVISIIGILLDAIGITLDIVQGRPTLFIKKTNRFSCELLQDTNQGKEVWTVTYDDDQSKKAWLGIVIPMGGGWSPAKRCEEIQRRLENFRNDGILSLNYRKDPNTPKQEVICVNTKLSSNCPLLLTLDVGIDGYKALGKMTTALRKRTTVYHGTEGKLKNHKFSRESPVIYLEPLLAKEDSLAGQ